jgi:hypothetical protein
VHLLKKYKNKKIVYFIYLIKYLKNTFKNDPKIGKIVIKIKILSLS